MINKKIGVVLLSVLFAFTLGYFGFRIIELIGSNPSENQELSMDSQTESSTDPTESASPTEIPADPTRVLDRPSPPVPKAVPTIIVSSPVPEQPTLTNETQIESVSAENSSTNSNSTPVVKPPTPVQRHDVPALKGRQKTNESRVDIAGNDFMEFVFIPPGEFIMGSPENEIDRFSDEGPQHSVKFAEGFWMGKYEVTQEQWTAVMKNNPSKFQEPKRPVENVSWDDCQKFITTLNSSNKSSYRLPSEEEWEYACRGWAVERFYWGNDPEDNDIYEYSWFAGNAGNQTHEIGLLRANQFELYDICGNVWEWCSDLYLSGSTSLAADSWRVCRGGGWMSRARNCRSAKRFGVLQSKSNPDLGFKAREEPVRKTPLPTQYFPYSIHATIFERR